MNEPIDYDKYEEEEFSFFNIYSLIHFVKNNVLQIGLFLLVFVIIYLVDHITNINMMIMAIQDQQMAAYRAKMQKKIGKSKK